VGPETRSDAELVTGCLRGEDEAWTAIIARYKRLIYSIPFRYGATPDDAADIFQAVCLELYSELSKLRKVESLRSWLMTVTTHQAFHWKQRHRARTLREGTELDEGIMESAAEKSPDVLADLEQAQVLHQAVEQLSPRCQELVHLLFFSDPPLPYDKVASRLGLAKGSIGFIRGRCLKRLQNELTRLGF
jgi:RNA polymerase sigma factor (sigma-70 family)